MSVRVAHPRHRCALTSPSRGVFRKWDTEAVDTMGQVLCVGMDHDGEAFVVFRQDDGHRRIDMLPGPRSRFSTSFNNTWAWMHEHNDPFSCRFAFGPQIGIMIAWDRTRGPRGTGLPKKPWKAMTKLFEDGHPKHVSFGVGWAYFFLRPDGRWYFKDPEDCYTTLSTYLDARGIGPGDIEVCICLYPRLHALHTCPMDMDRVLLYTANMASSSPSTPSTLKNSSSCSRTTRPSSACP